MLLVDVSKPDQSSIQISLKYGIEQPRRESRIGENAEV